jgi:molybdate transport system ATP-binding protein
LRIDVSFKLASAIGVLFGASGAGKTTLLRLIAGLSKPDQGHIVLDGETLFDASRKRNQPMRRRRIGMIFQEDLLFPHLKVIDNVRFGLKGWAGADAKPRVSEVASVCGIEHLLDRWPATLSGGESQRVGLARALAPRPRLLLCDEPVSALDLANRVVMLERLRDVQRAESIPILYVTHSPSEAVSLGTELFLLDQGKITARGLPLDILDRMLGGRQGVPAASELRNVFAGIVESHEPAEAATRVQLADGPELIVPYLERPIGSQVYVSVRGDDILLARQPVVGLSARNQITGVVERIVPHGTQAEVIVRTGGLCWMVSLVAPAVAQLELVSGSSVWIIVKARSCHVFDRMPFPG